MEPRDAERLLVEGDPLRDAEPVATRLLAIDEAEAIRAALHDAGIVCQLRLVKPGKVTGSRRDPHLDSSYSVLRPSWNVVVPAADLAKARALAEARLRTDVDGRSDTAAAAGAEAPAPVEPVELCRLEWDDAWALVERLGRMQIRAAVGEPTGDGSLEEQQAPVLVLPADLEYARKLAGIAPA